MRSFAISIFAFTTALTDFTLAQARNLSPELEANNAWLPSFSKERIHENLVKDTILAETPLYLFYGKESNRPVTMYILVSIV